MGFYGFYFPPTPLVVNPFTRELKHGKESYQVAKNAKIILNRSLDFKVSLTDNLFNILSSRCHYTLFAPYVKNTQILGVI